MMCLSKINKYKGGCIIPNPKSCFVIEVVS
jgi:hypothetical protein